MAEANKQTAWTQEEMVTIHLPKTREEKDDVFVSVNERSWLIQRGVSVQVPRCVYEVLLHKQEMEATIVAFEEAHAVTE